MKVSSVSPSKENVDLEEVVDEREVLDNWS